MRTHGIVTQIQQPYSTLSFGTSPWINPIAPIQPVSRATITLPLLSPTNQFHHPIQSRAMIAHPHNSIPLPTSSQCRIPMACPRKSIQSRRSSRVPPWRVPINQCHRPGPASVSSPHQSNPSPWSSHGGKTPLRAPMIQSHHPDPASVAWPHGVPPWINPIAQIQPMSHAPMNQSHLPDPASVTHPHGATPPINPITPIQSRTPDPITPPVLHAPMAHPHKSIPSPRSSQCCMPPWQAPWSSPIALTQPVSHASINQFHRPDPTAIVLTLTTLTTLTLTALTLTTLTTLTLTPWRWQPWPWQPWHWQPWPWQPWLPWPIMIIIIIPIQIGSCAVLLIPTLPPSVLIRRPSPYYPMPTTSSSPLLPFIPDRAFWTIPVTLPVTHTFHFGSPSTAYTGPVIHCLPPCHSVRHPSSRPV